MKCILLSAFLLLIAPLFLHAQSAELEHLDSLVGKVIKGMQATNKDKIWLVADRDIYAAGETIYYKAWIVDSLRNHISRSPKKLYVDLVNEKDSVVQRSLMNNGALQTNGSLPINEALPGGNYWLRAYAFYKAGTKENKMNVLPLYIVSLHKSDTLQSETKSETIKAPSGPSVTLFPEGGSIISGLPSTIAVKAVDKEGKPWMISGTLKNSRDTVLAHFSTNGQGLGKFTFYPKWFNTYTLHTETENGSDSILATLPHINFFAGQLSVEKQMRNRLVARVALEDSISKRIAVTYLLGISGDSLCFASEGTGNYKAVIPTEPFPGGVARLLLFDEKEQLLSERDVYINKKDADIKLTTDKNNYAGREDIQLSIQVRDAQYQPLLSSLAVSVTDSRIEDTTAFLNMDTLASMSLKEADLVLLTTTRKPATINLNSSLDNKQEVDEDSSFTISGRVLNAKGEPVSKRVVTLLANKKMFVLQTDTVSASGRFRFLLPELIDSTSFSAQISTLKGRRDEESHIVFDAAAEPTMATPLALKRKLIQPVVLHTSHTGFLDSSIFLAGMGKDYLKPVVVTTYKKEELTYDASKRVSQFSRIVTQDQIGPGMDMAENALLMVPGVHLMQGFLVIHGPSSIGGASAAGEPLIVLDGVRIHPTEPGLTTASPVLAYLNSIPYSTIDFLEVLTGAEGAIYGTEGGNGVILINTKSGGSSLVTTPGLQSFYSKGFQDVKAFPMPDYSLATAKNSKAPDARVTMYWNGNLYTDKKGRATVHFFSGDVATNYTVLVTAVTANGCVVQKRFHISRS